MAIEMYEDIYQMAQELNLSKQNLLYLKQSDKGYNSIALSCFLPLLINNINVEKMNIFLWLSTDSEGEEEEEETTQGPWHTDAYQENEGQSLRCVRNMAQKYNLPAENVLFYVPGGYDGMRDKVAGFVSRFVYKQNNTTEGGFIWFECPEDYEFGVLAKMLGL
jgi:hypothetical protein